ncbi:recombinase family protein [Ruminiclostridium cellulolyticum]|uniref:Recombinase n=1 Tax=Ruminiclostridium cellulolyticum (strain ATCC 35319 / DSM 5812 / JCM 6584 / H10) TaxID=394503 RepID=B8I7G8_RUMCH|nr:recombinase family protein [Ruminiclostridium cellulolyticum]ACL77039.1 Recombinase [Ruminiclostridium cellulolyticum H10]
MQRHMPLGYKISDGSITIDSEKADIVKMIFSSFISGKSMMKISQELTKAGVLNASGKPSWNHCSVGNILKNIKYIGDEYHPAVITENDYRTAETIRQERARQLNHSNNYLANSKTGIYPFSGKLICGECGAIFKRYTEHHNANKKCNWKCKRYIVNNRVCCRSAVIDDAQLEQAFTDIVKKVLEEPKLIYTRYPRPHEISSLPDNPKIRKLSNNPELIYKSGQSCSDPREAVRLLFDNAAEEYMNCSADDFTYQTNKLKNSLNDITSVEAFDRGLFLQIIRNITIYTSGILRFEFINGTAAETAYESNRKTKKERLKCREQEERYQ